MPLHWVATLVRGLGNLGDGRDGLGHGRALLLGPRGLLRGGGEQTGLPIAGVKSLADDSPFRYYKGLTEYNQWLFSYFDLEGAGQPGQGGQQVRLP